MKKIFDRCSIPTTSRPPVIVTSFENKVSFKNLSVSSEIWRGEGRMSPHLDAKSAGLDLVEALEFFWPITGPSLQITKAEIERLQQDYRNAKKESEARGLQLRDEQSKFDQLKKELYQLQRKKSACEIKLEEFEQMELPETNDDGILAADLAYRMDLLDTAKGELEVG
ncbi:unnamed protein product [Nesidiocoris tenuis]|uniref:Uncharacterized protein n=1 Tax=Nesidiocoris tenuis TaxID=355587 RepID=A0A6H5HEF2_9HEMI|nr:unnamed protein product [Nesidiocoris tenuis]